MKILSSAASWLAPVLGLLLCLAAVAPAWGQKKPPRKASASPALAPLATTGAQRGQAVEFVVTGTNLADPTGLDLAGPAKASIVSDPKVAQDGKQVKVRIEVPADAPVGAYPLRLGSRNGISNLRLFCVDDLPALAEIDGNHARASAQALPLPCVVSGRGDTEQPDFFKVTVAAGQRLSFDLLGRRIGSALDGQLFLYHPKTQRELAHDNDSPGCQGDARLSFTFKEAGEYLIEVRDVLNRGGPEYFYRLRVADVPLAVAPVPMAARHGSKVKVHFAGPLVDGTPPVDVDVPTDPQRRVVSIAPKGPGGLHGWPVHLVVSDHDELVEQEPNNEPAKANRVPVPGGITGRFEQSDDTDCFVFAGKKGQKLLLEVQTLELGSPTLVYLVLKNAKSGAEIARSNPQAPPPTDQRIEFAAPEDADYVLEVQHLHFAGGPSEIYHLEIVPADTFDLSLSETRCELAPGGSVPIGVQVNRRGYAGAIELTLLHAGGLTGSGVMKAGQNATALIVQARPDLPLGPHHALIQGKATVDGVAVAQLASVRATIGRDLNNLPYPPLSLLHPVAIGIKERAPFALAFRIEPAEAAPGVPLTVKVTATRDAGFAQEIVLNAPTGLPPNVAPLKLPNIPKDKQEAAFPLDIKANVPLGEYYLLFTARAKQPDGEVSTSAPPLVVVVGVPFELKAEPLDVASGAKAKLKISATRRAGYKGPIALTVRNLPANVSVAPGTIPAEKTDVELDVAVAAAAAPAERRDVEVIGLASALNNYQVQSPLFVVRVQKK